MKIMIMVKVYTRSKTSIKALGKVLTKDLPHTSTPTLTPLPHKKVNQEKRLKKEKKNKAKIKLIVKL